ncbi:MAG TPA: ABC transporter ATP-binding protein [Streptosporangiaceae bacterium]|jgi:putative ABC transport system ATP-binding protein
MRESMASTLRRGLAMSPEFRRGIAGTLVLALVATAGKVVVPVAVQQVMDSGLGGKNGPDLGYVRLAVIVCAVAVLLTAAASYLMNVRLYVSSESGLAALRTKAFRHVHDLSVLTQNNERRGTLVSRVTSDVDQISTFMQSGGIQFLVSAGQLIVALVLMAVYSWQLTIVVLVCFVPLGFAVRYFQRWVSAAYRTVRERVGDMLGGIGEAVVGAAVIRAHGIEDRTAARVDEAVDGFKDAQTRAQKLVAWTFSTSELVAALANAGVVALGVWLGVAGEITAGRLIAFLFLVTLFIAPLQTATEVLNQAQNAIAGWRRVLAVLDTEPDVPDPGERGTDLPRGAVDVVFDDVAFAYPGGPTVLRDVDLRIEPRRRVAVVGETGSGKTTFAKLLTRLMDPVSGRVLIDGTDLRDVRGPSLRERIVMVPQDGFLFDASLADNVRYGRPGASDTEVRRALDDLGLTDWADGLPNGLATEVGQRGESLSAGERQLVALARAYVADPDLLVMDEATSAVDPATEVRLQRALDGVTRGRTAISIAHRMSTAEAADEILVFDAGRIVQRGPHAELATVPGVYADLYASWIAQRSAV